MDSKQVANLKNISNDVKKPIIMHDLQDICKQKVLVNKITAEFLTTQIKLSEASKKLQEYSIENAKEKLVITNDLIELFEEQCSIFDEQRQEECIRLYKQLNDLNVCPISIGNLISELDTLDNKLKDLADRIDHFERIIPAEQVGTQYTIKKKLDLENSCSREFSKSELD